MAMLVSENHWLDLVNDFFQLPSEYCSRSVCLQLLGAKSTLYEFQHKGKIREFSFVCMDREVSPFIKRNRVM